MLTISGTERRSYPVYGDDLTKEWTRESGEKFFRETISGTLTFSGPDYDSIIVRPFGEKFGLRIEISQDGGATWATYWTGEFTLTDCDVNEDNHTISVTPTPVDKYTAILEGMEKEFDIVKLTPAISRVEVDKRPMLQVYRAGESVIGCYLAGMWWEQDCEAVTDVSELTRCGFSSCVSLNGVSISGEITPDATGAYTLSTLLGSFTAVVGSFTLESVVTPYDDGEYQWVDYVLRLYPTGNPSIGWSKSWRFEGTPYPSPYKGLYDLTPFGGATGTATLDFGTFDVYARLLTDSETYDEELTMKLPINDIGGMAGIYQRVLGYSDTNAVILSGASTTTPTEWGLKSPGVYYQMPTPAVFGATCYPMARNSWDAFSMWFIEPMIDIETYGVTQYAIKDSYPLAAVIGKLLAQIAPTLTFAEDALHSLFFYGLADPSFPYRLFLTPKSNALGAGYDIPAQKGTLSLRQLLDMLRDCFRCYWYIDGVNTFRIEHTKFFDNGLSYVAAQVGPDLTTLTVLRNGKAWGWNTSRYTFEKQSLPARYQFAWMDEVTRPFNGQPIDIISPYVQRDNIEQIQSQLFTTDVDYMRSNPGGCSKDGWALLCGSAQQNGGYKVPYYVTELSDIEYNLQNGPLSFIYLQRYYLYDLPARSYRIGADEGTALGVKKPKVQEVIYPAKNDPDPMRLVKTPLGNGTVGKMSVNLSSRTVNVTLNYAAE